MEDIQNIIEEAWLIYRNFEREDFIVKPSIPILFFGDKERYDKSKIKVITVGLNPSWREFEEDRFPKAKGITPENIKDKWKLYLESLNEYFKKVLESKPYEKWFKNFDDVLNGLDCSFYDGKKNTALHTDLCSPLATKPTWGNSSKDEKFEKAKTHLEAFGNQLWLKLVRILSPDIVIISVSEKYLENLKRIEFIENDDLNMWKTIYTVLNGKDGVPRKKPYEVKILKSKIGNNVIFGRASQTPFGSKTSVQKINIGKEIKKITLKF